MTQQHLKRILPLLLSLAFFPTFQSGLNAQGFYDDFSDGDAQDGMPVTWIPYPETTMSSQRAAI